MTKLLRTNLKNLILNTTIIFVFSLLMTGCFEIDYCPPDVRCGVFAEDHIGTWVADSADARFTKVVIGGSGPNYFADVWETCDKGSCYRGRSTKIGQGYYDDDISLSFFNSRKPSIGHLLRLQEDGSALLESFIGEKNKISWQLQSPDLITPLRREN